ncbi:hypothetical protein NECAME_16262 [Necator americanus]|uniref:Uncharacterized protein n=1 Tax=Necator americanus TaxID=51031 RepID=W2TZT9_NECAM|nr:hypothetical protein NECAME_16262 [Necator americanus]ETN86562.1 hypothetical protein NECAME_16262 [Necator americanus]
MDSALSHGRCNQLRRGFSRRLRTIAKDCAIVGVAIREARVFGIAFKVPSYRVTFKGRRFAFERTVSSRTANQSPTGSSFPKEEG